ncbi:hypothetical protein ACFQDG_16650 [Natronoarchaeum mannanilyticum]|uniref:Uncharacterized protein n=1 Tax=Natronoarchaeum mannanilyticum TaxID=926360 RepID=A0AAV3TBR1_9EURY
MTDEADRAADDATESAADTADSDTDAASWWSIEGETTGERVRDGLPQLAIIVVTVWLGTSIAYNVLSAAFDPISATASIAIGSLYVGLRLRRWLTVDGGDAEKREDESSGDAADERENASDVDAADEREDEPDADAAPAE